MKMNEYIKEMIQVLGIQKTMVMVGAKHPVYDNSKNSVAFKFGLCKKYNYVVFQYDIGKDLYNLKLMKISKCQVKKEDEFNGLYNDMVNNVFESNTGLRKRLF